MKLYNSLTRRVEPFQARGAAVTVYMCGITPYDTTHLGHAFTYASADVLVRHLEFLGHRVLYAQNVTDIDDEILKRAREVGEDWRALGNRWTAHYIRDMQALNVRPPDFFPRATDVIPDIVAAVQRLLDAGLAYESGGSVYFHIDAWPAYGRLSRIPRDGMLPVANERGNVPDDPRKRHPLDFVLWQAQAPGEPAWDSPWGPGRPGWHIECSTMAGRYLGPPVGIHGGGADLIFPHHESEIAQAEPIGGGRPFARFWFHTAMVRHEGEKMSKSLGNLVMVRNLLESHSPDALRLYLASHHYRQVWTHETQALARAETLARGVEAALREPGGNGSPLDPTDGLTSFVSAMGDDLNTPVALLAMERFADAILHAARAGRDVKSAQDTLRTVGRVLGLRMVDGQPEPRVMEGWSQHLQRFTEPAPAGKSPFPASGNRLLRE